MTGELLRASLVAQAVKNPPAMRETRVHSPGWEDLLEKGMATHSSILAWRSLWTEEPGRLQSMGSQSIRPNWTTFTFSRAVEKQASKTGRKGAEGVPKEEHPTQVSAMGTSCVVWTEKRHTWVWAREAWVPWNCLSRAVINGLKMQLWALYSKMSLLTTVLLSYSFSRVAAMVTIPKLFRLQSAEEMLFHRLSYNLIQVFEIW